MYNATTCSTKRVGGRSGFAQDQVVKVSTSNKEGLARHLQSGLSHAQGFQTLLGREAANQVANQNWIWPVNQTLADKLAVDTSYMN